MPCRGSSPRPISSTCPFGSLTRAAVDRKVRRAAISFIYWNVDTITDFDSTVLAGLASLDGATVRTLWPTSCGRSVILRHPPSGSSMLAVRRRCPYDGGDGGQSIGPVLKVSEDGIITFFDRERVWDI